MNEDIKNKLGKLSLKEIIGYSIHSEDVASTYYWTLAKVFEPNELVKAKFEALANDEKLHKEALLHFYNTQFGDEDYVIPEGLPPFESVIDVKTVETFMEAIETAMENEHNAFETYTMLAKLHKEHRKLFKYLALTEKGHYETLKQDLKFFTGEIEDDHAVGTMNLSEIYARPVFRPPDMVR
ncbi:MAG: ferritin family protein [Thermoplasmata archaeon]|nr:ferritin family protein [Thermoplasmata archaeon]